MVNVSNTGAQQQLQEVQPAQQQELHISQAAPPTTEQPQAVPSKDDSAYVQPPPPAYSQNDDGQKQYEQQRQRLVTPLARLGEEPADVDCPYCRQTTRTGVTKNDSSMTIISGVLIGLLCICLACLPCCMGACADVDHHCTKCGKQLTHRPYDGQTQVVANLPQDMVPSSYSNQSAPNQPQQPQQAMNGHAG